MKFTGQEIPNSHQGCHTCPRFGSHNNVLLLHGRKSEVSAIVFNGWVCLENIGLENGWQESNEGVQKYFHF
jgi:hypothetical protein